MIRELINKFNRSLSERMVAPRRRHTAPVKVWFEPEVSSERSRELARSACILGETVDVSRTGVGFLVPAIRFKEKYLVGQERTLNVEIDLPTGRVCMKAIGRRYERVGIHVSTERYLVGVHILEMDTHNRDNYDLFVKNGSRKVRGTAGALELGID
jgi:hypothetical protein